MLDVSDMIHITLKNLLKDGKLRMEFGTVKVIQGAKTESVPEIKNLSEERMFLFDEELMSFTMGNLYNSRRIPMVIENY